MFSLIKDLATARTVLRDERNRHLARVEKAKKVPTEITFPGGLPFLNDEVNPPN